MKLKTFLPMAAIAMTAASCVSQQGIGIKLENMDTSAQPGTDFYQYACGGWMKANPLKPEYARFGSFNIVDEENNRRIREIIEGLSTQKNEKGSLGQKIGDLYALRMDSVRMNKDGVTPVMNDLQRVAAVENTQQWIDLVIQMNNEGIGFEEL
ncbi:MAG: M13 family peptidase, partial [Bacteroidaceae bacterium]|nr:M13 family peptidase [Bacteroidaceae bacterium]